MPKSGVSKMADTLYEKGKQFVENFLSKVGDMTLSELASSNVGDSIPDELNRILDYLPIEFQDESEKKYVDALILAAKTSFENGLYQFAYVQYHMLFMTAIYFALLKVYWQNTEKFDIALRYMLKDRYNEFASRENTKNDKLYFGSFASINESEVFLFLRFVGMDDSLLDMLKDRVKERNKYTHANGNLMLTSSESFLSQITESNKAISKVLDLLKDSITQLYKDTIISADFYDPEIRAYLDPDEQIKEEIVRKYSLSSVEINWLRKIKTSDFKDCNGYEHIKELHIALMHYYDKITESTPPAIADSYYAFKYKNNATAFVENELGISSYRCGKEGCDFPVYECPECGEEQLAFDAETGKFHCFACDADFTTDDYDLCENCNKVKPVGEAICEDCWNAAMEKD